MPNFLHCGYDFLIGISNMDKRASVVLVQILSWVHHCLRFISNPASYLSTHETLAFQGLLLVDCLLSLDVLFLLWGNVCQNKANCNGHL